MRLSLPSALIAVSLLITACGSQQSQQQPAKPVEAGVVDYLNKGYAHLSAGNTKKAERELERAIAMCDKAQAEATQTIYSARSPTESLLYLIKAAANDEDAVVNNTDCSDSLYLMGYVNIDFGRLTEAETYLQRAHTMAPSNAMYLSELGHVYQLRRDWNVALELFVQAEEAATGFSPEATKTKELLRAKRGIGYTLIELGELDKAEEKFNECLAIDKNDAGTIRELKYIKSLRANAKSG